ncbi:MAG TPA: malto-oligosyltrehalose trehalohydrolase [Candidatus Atribacteria bacterium]|nr:malto-oligosyltrehalose trehalohydrolase [Candidatus Atribacteria bacterium]
MELGAKYFQNENCEFTVWAPCLKGVALDIIYPDCRTMAMEKGEDGYWRVLVNNINPSTKYFYLLENARQRPDPASFFQPEGVHGPSAVVDHTRHQWEDHLWGGIPLQAMIIYELHVGTFTPEGTFEAIIPRLQDLRSLGINTIEIMPVAQFPGERNWGYDGAYLFAVQNSYGGPDAFKNLINACHQQEIAVILDVVYNHLGPEGNYLEDFGPYFTDHYKTPWGKAINFDGAYSDGVRKFFIQNALYWFQVFHIDALRLDAIHGIYDHGARHILEELSEEVEKFSDHKGKKHYLIAESDLNDPRIVRPRKKGGYGIDAQWCDDFHHSLHSLLTGEKKGYYADFGTIGDLKKSFEQGFVLSGNYSSYRKRRHGASPEGLLARQFVVYSQNHDQVGNRVFGERLSTLVAFERLKLAAGAVFISPYIPLVFMGEEYGENAPFLYFVSHSDVTLIKAVREGRKKEFESFLGNKEPPDPQSKESFLCSKILWEKRFKEKYRVLLDFYQRLIALRKKIPALHAIDRTCLSVSAIEEKGVIVIHRWNGDSHIWSLLCFNEQKSSIMLSIPEGRWIKLLDSSEQKWLGPGSLLPETIAGKAALTVEPFSFILYLNEVKA